MERRVEMGKECLCVCVCVLSCRMKMRQVMEEGEDGYFSGDQIPVFICELLLRHRLARNVFGLLSLKVEV